MTKRSRSTKKCSFLTDYTRNVCARTLLYREIILGGVKYLKACDCQRSYVANASFFVWRRLGHLEERSIGYRSSPRTASFSVISSKYDQRDGLRTEDAS